MAKVFQNVNFLAFQDLRFLGIKVSVFLMKQRCNALPPHPGKSDMPESMGKKLLVKNLPLHHHPLRLHRLALPEYQEIQAIRQRSRFKISTGRFDVHRYVYPLAELILQL
jgi:hypothetical protein